MSKKSKKLQKNAIQGTYAICITTGLIIGLGLGALVGSALVSVVLGGIVGTGAGYFFTHLKKSKKHH